MYHKSHLFVGQFFGIRKRDGQDELCGDIYCSIAECVCDAVQAITAVAMKRLPAVDDWNIFPDYFSVMSVSNDMLRYSRQNGKSLYVSGMLFGVQIAPDKVSINNIVLPLVRASREEANAAAVSIVKKKFGNMDICFRAQTYHIDSSMVSDVLETHLDS